MVLFRLVTPGNCLAHGYLTCIRINAVSCINLIAEQVTQASKHTERYDSRSDLRIGTHGDMSRFQGA